MISTAAAPSEICEEVAAVTRPPSTKHGRQRGQLLVGGAGPHPLVEGERTLAGGIALVGAGLGHLVLDRARRVASGTISLSKRPSAMARAARSWDRRAKRSISSRLIPHRVAISSAHRP